MSDAVIHIVRRRATPTIQNNPSMTVLNPAIRAQVETTVRWLLEGVMPE
jgi:hypothetical protein